MQKQLLLFLAILIFPISIQSATLNGIVGAPAPGSPVAGVKVVLVLGSSNGLHVDSTVTNDSGIYVFNNVATGIIWLTTTKTGYNAGSNIQLVSSATATLTANISITRNGSPIFRRNADASFKSERTFHFFDLKGRNFDPLSNRSLLVVAK